MTEAYRGAHSPAFARDGMFHFVFDGLRRRIQNAAIAYPGNVTFRGNNYDISPDEMVDMARKAHDLGLLHLAGVEIDANNIAALAPEVIEGGQHHILPIHQNPDLCIRVRVEKEKDGGNIYPEQVLSDRIRNTDPSPQVVPILTGSHRLPEGEYEGPAFTIQPFLKNGENGVYSLFPDRPPETAYQMIGQLAKALAGLHRLRPDGGYGFFDPRLAKEENLLVGTHESYASRLTDGLDECLKVLVDCERLSTRHAKAFERYFTESDIAQLVSSQPAVVLHGDGGPHNLVVQKTKEEDLLGHLIDFEEIQAGPVAHDLAIATRFLRQAWYYLQRKRRTIDIASLNPALLRAYEAAGGTLPENIEDQLQLLLRRIDITQAAFQETRRRVLDPQKDQKFIQDAIFRLSILEEEGSFRLPA